MSTDNVAASSEHMLELRNIRKVFNTDLLKKADIAVNDLSLVFKKSACTGLLGHNGAGKTTTLRIIFGLIKPDRGSVFFNGHIMQPRDRGLIGYMPEVNKINQSVTPYEALISQLNYYDIRKSRHERHSVVKDLLLEVGLDRHARKQVKQLSKGLARRLAWAMAVVHDPEIAVLDEPYAGLDPSGRELMNSWITAFKERKKTLILCTHELSSAQSLCDDIHILQQGKLAFSTITPVEGQIELSGDQNQTFVLELSGIDVGSLDKLKQQAELPEWQTLTSTSFLQRMIFSKYDHALNWLRAALSQGLIIVAFHEQSKNNLQELLPYFRKDQS